MRIPLPRPRSLAGQLFAMQVVLVAASSPDTRCSRTSATAARPRRPRGGRRRRWPAAVADSPSVRRAIAHRGPDGRAPAVRRAGAARHRRRLRDDHEPATGIRWTHPDPEQIGKHFLGHIGARAAGRTFTETYTGTLGASVRAVTPVRDDGDGSSAWSAPGITVETISAQVQRPGDGPARGGGAARSRSARSARTSINARLRRHTHGMNAAELSRMHDYHQAALHAVREGLLMLDGQCRSP